jgi:hypothetical protein
MAYAFTSAGSQYLSATTTIFRNQSKITLAAWVYRNAAGTAQLVGCGKVAADRFIFYPWVDNNLYYTIGTGGGLAYGFQSGAGPTASAWNHIVQVFDGTQTGNSNRLKGFLNGLQQTLSYAGAAVPANTVNDPDIEDFTINRFQAASSFGNGSYAEIGVWQEALTAAEIASLAKGMTCDKIRPQNLVFYAPLVRDLQDQKGGLTITNNNGATVANHPRVYA